MAARRWTVRSGSPFAQLEGGVTGLDKSLTRLPARTGCHASQTLSSGLRRRLCSALMIGRCFRLNMQPLSARSSLTTPPSVGVGLLRIVSLSVAGSPFGSFGGSLRYQDGLVQRPLQRFVRVQLGGRLFLPDLSRLDTDVVDLFLCVQRRQTNMRAQETVIGGEGSLTSVRQLPAVVMRNPSSPWDLCKQSGNGPWKIDKVISVRLGCMS